MPIHWAGAVQVGIMNRMASTYFLNQQFAPLRLRRQFPLQFIRLQKKVLPKTHKQLK